MHRLGFRTKPESLHRAWAQAFEGLVEAWGSALGVLGCRLFWGWGSGSRT